MKFICGSLEAVLNEFSDRFDFNEQVSGSLIGGSGSRGSDMTIEVSSTGLECFLGGGSILGLLVVLRSPLGFSCGRLLLLLGICCRSCFLSI